MALCNHLKFIPWRLKLLFELNFVGVYFSARASCWCCLTRKTSHQNKLLSLSSAFPGWRWAGQAWSLKLYSSPLTSDLALTSQPRGQSADSGPDQRRCVSRIITSLLIKLMDQQILTGAFWSILVTYLWPGHGTDSLARPPQRWCLGSG